MSIEISPTLPAYDTGKPWWRGEAWSALLLGALSMIAGVLVAVIWRAVAPMVQGVVSISNGQKSAFYANAKTRALGQDGTFGICGAVAAILLAVAAFLWFRRRGPIGAAFFPSPGAGISAGLLRRLVRHLARPGPRFDPLRTAKNVTKNGTFDLPAADRCDRGDLDLARNRGSAFTSC